MSQLLFASAFPFRNWTVFNPEMRLHFVVCLNLSPSFKFFSRSFVSEKVSKTFLHVSSAVSFTFFFAFSGCLCSSSQILMLFETSSWIRRIRTFSTSSFDVFYFSIATCQNFPNCTHIYFEITIFIEALFEWSAAYSQRNRSFHRNSLCLH